MAFGLAMRLGVKGVPELLKKFKELDEKLARKALRKAVREAAKPILAEAKSLVPVETRTLKKALGVKVKSYRSGSVVVAMIGVRKDKAGKPLKHKRKVKLRRGWNKGQEQYRDPIKYAHLVEFGTRAHAIGKGDVLARKGRKAKQRQLGRKHPGAKAHPFLRPALAKNKRRVKQIIRETLAAALTAAKASRDLSTQVTR